MTFLGIAVTGSVTELSLEQWRRVLSVNLDGVFLGTKHALAAMRRLGAGVLATVIDPVVLSPTEAEDQNGRSCARPSSL